MNVGGGKVVSMNWEFACEAGYRAAGRIVGGGGSGEAV